MCLVVQKIQGKKIPVSEELTKQNRLTLAQNFSVCDKKKSMFVQYLEARGFFSKLGIKTSLSNIPLIGDISF